MVQQINTEALSLLRLMQSLYEADLLEAAPEWALSLRKTIAEMEAALRALTQRPAAQAGEVDIKSRVSELIAEHGTLRAAARSLNIDVGYLSRLERGDKVHPSSETLAKIGLRDAGVKYQRLAFLPTQPAAQAAQVPEGPTQEAMTSKWCWWFGDGERFQIVDTESEAHGEAQSYIDCGEPGEERAYSIARVQHPIDALGMDWLALHVAESIAENVCCWCDDNTGAEEPSIMLSPDDSKALGLMVATFLRQRVGVDWWTADQKTVRLHTYVSGSTDGAPDATAAQQGDEHG